MSDENLSEVLDDQADLLAYKKQKTIEKLGERAHLTLSQVAKLVAHDDHGTVVGDITLQELINVQLKKAVAAKMAELSAQGRHPWELGLEEEASETAARPAKAKKAAKKTAKKVAKKAPKSADGKKADFGKKKPRLNRDQGYKEIIAALKAAGTPCGRKELEEATGFTGVQVRTFCTELAKMGKVNILGKGGRSTKYENA